MNFPVLTTVSRHLVSAILLILALGCTHAVIAESMSFGALPNNSSLDSSTPSLPEENTDLTLREAARLTLQRNPELAAFAKEKRALEGATLQAGLLRNPELSVNVENIGNVQPLSGDINSQKSVAQEVVQQLSTIRIYQVIELGGKRAARVSAALLGEELAVKDYEAKRVELVARMANVFTEVLAGQERLRLAEENLQLAQQVANMVAKRVRAGKVPPIE